MDQGNVALRLALLAACLPIAGACWPGPRGSDQDAPQPTSDLTERPLYTFDETEVERYLPIARRVEPDLARRVVHLGRKNVGQPYEIFLLGEFPFEYIDPQPIYCLSKSDCLVFCEHMFAMALSEDWWTFLRTLQRLRYRDGVVGMLTRNHYTIADWNPNNAFLFEDMTTRLGDRKACVPLHQVCRRAKFFAKHGIGQDIADEVVADAYIPKQNVAGVADELCNGDFVNIIRGTEKSQYAGHTGLIAIADDGTVNFLHSGRPRVREQPLVEYLMGSDSCLGVKILRLRPDAESIMKSALAASDRATIVSPDTIRAALDHSPVMSTGAPKNYSADWARAMQIQSYRLTHDSPVDPELQAGLEHADKTIGDELAIPARDRAFGVLTLTEGRLALIQPDVMVYGASVPKIAIVLAYFETHPEAQRRLVPDIRRELELVIKRSSNELAARYSQIVGLDKIREILVSRAYRFYDKKHGGGIWTGKHYGIDEPRTGDPINDLSHGVTMRQCLRYYLMMEQGRLVNAEVSAMLKEIFAAPALEFHDDGFVRGLTGRDVTVLRKSGRWETWHLDTARVVHGDKLYLMAGVAQHPDGGEYLARMAAAVDDLVCGPHEKDRPFAHNLFLHETPADFADGTFTDAEPAEERGVVLRNRGADSPPGYQSAVIRSDLKFNEVVPSWNVDAPDHAGFSFELRVGRTFDDSWSPWLYVGQWGDAVPEGDVRTKCDEGSIDVDYFRSKTRYDRVQYRVRAYGLAENESMRIERVGICVSDTTGIPTALPQVRPNPPTLSADAWKRTLPVPFRSQKTDRPGLSGLICSPTSLSMVMEYRGVDRPTVDVADAAFDQRYRIYGNWPANVQAAYRFGLPGYLARFSHWDDVKRMIAAGQPLIISMVAGPGELRNAPYKEIGGHLIVLTGFTEDGMVTVNDPATTDPEKGRYNCWPEDLDTVWMRAKGGTAYVLLPTQ